MNQFRKFGKHLFIPHYAKASSKFRVLVTNDSDLVDSWLGENVFSSSHQVRAVGLDVEWEPNPRKYCSEYQKTDLIQIATPQEVLVYQCRHIHTPIHTPPIAPNQWQSPEFVDASHNQHVLTLPDRLLDLVACDTIIKTGVGVVGDLQRLGNDFDINISSSAFQDVASAAQRYRLSASTADPSNTMSLYGLAKHFCKSKARKDKAIQRSNWGTHTLSNDQIRYAAYDALMGIDIYLALEEYGVFASKRRKDYISICSNLWHKRDNAHLLMLHNESISSGSNSSSSSNSSRSSSSSSSNTGNKSSCASASDTDPGIESNTESSEGHYSESNDTPLMHLAGRAMLKFYYTLMNESLEYQKEISRLLRRTDTIYLEQVKLGSQEGIDFVVRAENLRRRHMKGAQQGKGEGEGEEIQELGIGAQLPAALSIDSANIFRTLLPRLLSRHGVTGRISIEQRDQVLNIGEGASWNAYKAHIFLDTHHVESGSGKTEALAKEQACRLMFIKLLEKESECNIPDLIWLSCGADKGDGCVPNVFLDMSPPNAPTILPLNDSDKSMSLRPINFLDLATAKATVSSTEKSADVSVRSVLPKNNKTRGNGVEHWLVRERMMFR